jgi:hypothetical protein
MSETRIQHFSSCSRERQRLRKTSDLVDDACRKGLSQFLQQLAEPGMPRLIEPDLLEGESGDSERSPACSLQRMKGTMSCRAANFDLFPDCPD